MTRIEVISKSRFVVYRARARKFEKQMHRAAAEGASNSVGLLGVQCAISICDALAVQRSGQRWSGQDHAGVVGIVGSLGIPDADRALRQISRVLEVKNRVEHESREFTRPEAEEVRRTVSRVTDWVTSLLPS